MAQSDVSSIPPQHRDTLTVTQAAQLLGVSAWTLRKWTAQSLLASERTVGGHRRYRRTELERFRAELLAHGDASGVHEHLHRLAVLSEVAGAVFAQLEPAETLRIVCEKLLTAMHCTVAIVSAYDAESASVRTLADYDIRGHLWGDQQAYALHDLPIIAHVVAQQVPVVVNRSDLNADPGELARMASHGAQSLLILPLAFGGVTIGVAKLLDSSGERHYSRAELTLALAIADQAAIALHNVDLYETARRRNRELEALLGIAAAVTAAGGVESVMRVVAQALLQAL
jgi:excisionase family DNA binding protein